MYSLLCLKKSYNKTPCLNKKICFKNFTLCPLKRKACLALHMQLNLVGTLADKFYTLCVWMPVNHVISNESKPLPLSRSPHAVCAGGMVHLISMTSMRRPGTAQRELSLNGEGARLNTFVQRRDMISWRVWWLPLSLVSQPRIPISHVWVLWGQ